MRRGQTNPQRGLPRAPKWDRRELALLDTILDRAKDGQATARYRDLEDARLLDLPNDRPGDP